MVCGCPFGGPSDRLLLVGCDHRVSKNKMLMTPESIDSFERTEAFEWAKRRGNRKVVIGPLQPFKLRYAMMLADFGHEDLAREYIVSIRSCTGIWENLSESTSPASGNASGAAYSREFMESQTIFEDRVCVSSGTAKSFNEEKGASKGRKSALGSIVKSVFRRNSSDEHHDKASAPISKNEHFESKKEDGEIDLINLKDAKKWQRTEEMKDGLITSDDKGLLLEKPEKDENEATNPSKLLRSPFVHTDGATEELLGNKVATKEKGTDSLQPSASAPPSLLGESLAERADELKPKTEEKRTPLSSPVKEGKQVPVSEPPSELPCCCFMKSP